MFGVSHHALWVRLGQLGFTLKKTHKISRAQRGPTVALRARTGQTQRPARFLLDECGVDHRLYIVSSVVPCGNAFTRRWRVNGRSAPALSRPRRRANWSRHWCFKAVATRRLWTPILRKCCYRAAAPGGVIVLDNARFHQSLTTLRLVAAASCRIILYPPILPTSTPSNISGPPSKPASAKTWPPPPTPSFLSPICAYLIGIVRLVLPVVNRLVRVQAAIVAMFAVIRAEHDHDDVRRKGHRRIVVLLFEVRPVALFQERRTADAENLTHVPAGPSNCPSTAG